MKLHERKHRKVPFNVYHLDAGSDIHILLAFVVCCLCRADIADSPRPRTCKLSAFTMETPPREVFIAGRRTRSALSEIPSRDEVRIVNNPAVTTVIATPPTALLNGRLLNEVNVPASFLTPSPSPDELVIQQRGRKSLPVTWSPDIDVRMDNSLHLRDHTPIKNGTGAVRSTIVTRSTPRKRLILTDARETGYQTPEKNKLKLGSPNPKRSRLEKIHKHYNGSLGSALKGLSQDQLIEVIQNMVEKHPNLENEMKESLPAPDLKPLEEKLNELKKNIFKSLPNSRLISKTDSPSYNRAAVHVTAFKRCVLDQGRILLDSQHWDSVIEYVLLAWSYVRATPVWDNPPHNAARRQCFKSLASQCMTALKKATWTKEQCSDLRDRLNSMVDESEDIKACLKQIDVLLSQS